jgi:dihydrolipoamide dehydrogenase
MSESVDTVIIGGGPGGVPAALFLLSKGRSVVLFETTGNLGGTCLFEGCIPSKIFIETAKKVKALKNIFDFGIEGQFNYKVNWSAVLKRKETILNRRSQAALSNLRSFPKCRFIDAQAKFVESNKVAYSEEGKEHIIEAKNTIIATGSISFIPSIAGIKEAITSEELLSIDHIPRSIAIIGGGPIGIEAAAIFSQMGTKCTLIEMLPRILPNVDKEVAGHLERILKSEQAIDLFTSAKVMKIARKSSAKQVVFDYAGKTHNIEAEIVLVAVGRRPRVEGLGLDKVDIEFDNSGIKVNEFLETTQKGVYACGDVIGGYMYAHTATSEGLTCAKNILLGNKVKLDYSYPPAGLVFSEPEIASCGLTEGEARKRGIVCIMDKYPYKMDARAQIAASTEGFIKLVAEKTSGKILGVHIIGPDASNLISEAAVLVNSGVTLKKLADTVHPHPSLSEGILVLGRQMLAEFYA